MLSEISWEEFKEWTIYAELEPFDRDLYQLAQIAQLLWNINRDSKKYPKGLPLTDFVLGFEEPEKKQDAAYIQSVIEGWITVSNITFEKKQKTAAMVNIETLSGRIELDDVFSGAMTTISSKLDGFGKKFDNVFGGVAIGAAAGMAAVSGLAAGIMALGDTGSKILGVEEAFNRLSAAAGSTGDSLIGGLNEGLRNTVDSMELMQAANKAMSAGVKLTAADMRTFGATAREMAKAAGTDASTELNKLFSAMQTGRTRGIALSGVIVDLKKAEDDYAEALGTTSDKLTEANRLEAHRQGILQASKDKLDQLGESQLSFSERLDQAKVAIGDWWDNLAKGIAASPHVAAAFDAIGKALQKAFGMVPSQALSTLIGWIDKFADAVAEYGPPFIAWVGKAYQAAMHYGGIIVDWLKEIIKWVKDVAKAAYEAWDALPGWFKESAKNAAIAGAGLYMFGGAAVDAGKSVIDLGNDFGTMLSAFADATVLYANHGKALMTWVTNWSLMLAKLPTMEALLVVMKGLGAGVAGLVSSLVVPALLTIGAVSFVAFLDGMKNAWHAWREGRDMWDYFTGRTKPEDMDFLTVWVRKLFFATTGLQTFNDELRKAGVTMDGLKKSADWGKDTRLPFQFNETVNVSAGLPTEAQQKALDLAAAKRAQTNAALAAQADKLKAVNTRIKELVTGTKNLTQANKDLIQHYTRLTLNAEQIAVKLGLTVEEVTQEIAFQKAADGIDEMNDAWLRQLDVLIKLRNESDALKLAYAQIHEKTVVGVPKWLEIMQEEPIELKPPKFDTATWKSGLKDFQGSIAKTFYDTFTSGADVKAALKGLAVNFTDLVIQPVMKNFNKSMTMAVAAGAGGAGIVGGAMEGETGSLIGSTAGAVGGALVGSMTGLGAAALAGNIAASVALGAATMGIGIAAVAAYQGLKKLYDAHKNNTRISREELAENMGFDQLDDLYADLEARGGSFLANMGKNAIGKQDVEGNKRWMEDVVGFYQAAEMGSNEWLNAALKAGEGIPEYMRETINTLITTKGLTEENARLLMGLSETVPSIDEVTEAANRYGLKLDELGEKVSQMMIDEEADQIVKDFDTLTLAGASFDQIMKTTTKTVTDTGEEFGKMSEEAQEEYLAAGGVVTEVTEGMAADIQKLVIDSIKLGGTLPETMKPMIEKLIESGKLTDEFGTKLTDTSKLKFSKPLNESIDDLVLKMDELIQSFKDLGDEAVDSFNRIEKAAPGAASAAGGVSGNVGGHRGGPSVSGHSAPTPRGRAGETATPTTNVTLNVHTPDADGMRRLVRSQSFRRELVAAITDNTEGFRADLTAGLGVA